MKSFQLLLTSTVVAMLASCASKHSGYDTPNPYGTPDGGQAVNIPSQPVAPANPTYDTPAAYEDSSAAPEAAAPVVPSASGNSTPTAGAGGRIAVTHTVVKGDTLGGIAAKYKVPMTSIMKANNMTKDTVVLGKKLVIPAR